MAKRSISPTDHANNVVFALRNLVELSQKNEFDAQAVNWLCDEVGKLATAYDAGVAIIREHRKQFSLSRPNAAPVTGFGICDTSYHGLVFALASAVLYGIWYAADPKWDGEKQRFADLPVGKIAEDKAMAVACAARLDTDLARLEGWGPLDPIGVERLVQSLRIESFRIADKPDTKPDTKKNSLPDSPDVRDLCRLLQKGLPAGKSQIEIAREFTGKDGAKADSLLRQARRYRHLWW